MLEKERERDKERVCVCAAQLVLVYSAAGGVRSADSSDWRRSCAYWRIRESLSVISNLGVLPSTSPSCFKWTYLDISCYRCFSFQCCIFYVSFLLSFHSHHSTSHIALSRRFFFCWSSSRFLPVKSSVIQQPTICARAVNAKIILLCQFVNRSV